MKQAIITIKPDGEMTLEAVGFKGKGCDVTKPLEAALGLTTGRTNKAEYDEQEQSHTGHQSVGGVQ